MKLEGLVKTYDNGVTAVNKINLKMYRDQLFVLLGHNGAGKTSLISILTGLYEATTGSAEIFGYDMFEDANVVRQFMGICPQFDVLFELLTPQEHLEIFYDFKVQNPDPELKKKEIDKLIEDVGLEKKRNDLGLNLSGGQQRQLSAALAFCGGSKLIILDEPTSSLDLSARR
jgi:ATP-binding cassette, subfamily A (ABC1), member 3